MILKQKMHERADQKSRSCWLFFFFMFVKLSITNFSLKDKLSMVISTWRFSSIEISDTLCAIKFAWGEWVDYPSWQCICTLISHCTWILGSKFNNNISPPSSLFSKYSQPSVTYFYSQNAKWPCEGNTGRYRHHQTWNNMATKKPTSKDFDVCFKQWKLRWNRCIIINGEYFIENNID